MLILLSAPTLPTRTLTRGCLRKLGCAMRTTRRFNGNLHRTGRTVFHVWHFCRRVSQFIYHPDQKKHRSRYDEKVNQKRDEVAVIPGYRSRLGGVCGSM